MTCCGLPRSGPTRRLASASPVRPDLDAAARRAAADANVAEAFDLVRQHSPVPGRQRRDFGAAIAIASGHPIGYFNPILVLDPSTTASDVAAALDWLAGLGLPASVHVEDGTDPEIGDALRARGLGKPDLPETVMVLDPIPPPEPRPDDARIRSGGLELIEDWHRGLGAGPTLRAILNADVVADSRVRIAVAVVDGEPVAGAMVVRTGNTVGVYSVATLEHARRRGFGRAVTWAAIDAVRPAQGGSIAVLQSSPMGVSLYASMGFEAIGSITVFATPLPPVRPASGAADEGTGTR